MSNYCQFHHSLLWEFHMSQLQMNMPFQVEVENGGKRFATFLLKIVSYEDLLCTSSSLGSIKKYCSSLAHPDEDKNRLRYRDKEGNIYGECLPSGCFCVLGNALYCERNETPRLQEHIFSSRFCL